MNTHTCHVDFVHSHGRTVKPSHTHTHIYIYMYIYTYTHTHTQTYVHTHTHAHMRKHTHSNTQSQTIDTYACIHTQSTTITPRSSVPSWSPFFCQLLMTSSTTLLGAAAPRGHTFMFHTAQIVHQELQLCREAGQSVHTVCALPSLLIAQPQQHCHYYWRSHIQQDSHSHVSCPSLFIYVPFSLSLSLQSTYTPHRHTSKHSTRQ